jgi:hypothetical protein
MKRKTFTIEICSFSKLIRCKRIINDKNRKLCTTGITLGELVKAEINCISSRPDAKNIVADWDPKFKDSFSGLGSVSLRIEKSATIRKALWEEHNTKLYKGLPPALTDVEPPGMKTLRKRLGIKNAATKERYPTFSFRMCIK